jgi:hypothetical protein
MAKKQPDLGVARRAFTADDIVEHMNKIVEGNRFKLRGGNFTKGCAVAALSALLAAWALEYVVEKPLRRKKKQGLTEKEVSS